MLQHTNTQYEQLITFTNKIKMICKKNSLTAMPVESDNFKTIRTERYIATDFIIGEQHAKSELVHIVGSFDASDPTKCSITITPTAESYRKRLVH